jgi:hypothetical protein
MAYKLVLSLPTPATLPADGWMVGYRILGSGGAYTVAGPFVAMPIEITTVDPVGTLYEGYIIRDCGVLESTQYFWQTPCNCVGVGYEEAPSGLQCEATDEVAATVTNSGYCLAASQNGVYASYCTRIYNPGFVDADLAIDPFTIVPLGGGTDPGIYAQLIAEPQWRDTTASAVLGPFNREGVWIDSDCDGDKDALGVGVQTTVSYVYNNPGASKTIHVGIAADNQFQLVVNGAIVATFGLGTDYQFKVWHIIPITVVSGPNYINGIATGDGSVNDAIGMVVYDNTAVQIASAATDLDLTIPFASHSLRGTSFDVATCPANYSLDTSGGAGNYTCVRTLYKACNTLV